MGLNQRYLARDLLRWFGRHGRDLPWREVCPDPYRVWLSEIMLQQTVVATVAPYFEKFTQRWPDLNALARASLDEVLRAWAGLGYYARARSLHRCARIVVKDHHGRFPEDEKELRALPGIGPYTAAAMSAIAFGRSAVVVDGNIKRVMARMFAIENLDEEKIYHHAEQITPKKRAGDYAQAVMDLGAMICTPRNPNCGSCPWQKHCRAYQTGRVDLFGRRAKKPPKPHRKGRVFILRRHDGAVFLRRRPRSGLLGAMMEFPSCGWDGQQTDPPLKRSWKKIDPPVRHVFTHFSLELDVHYAVLTQKQTEALAKNQKGKWAGLNKISAEALPSLMRKVWRAYDARAKT